MSPLEYTLKRLRAFLDEIRHLSTSEFPYPQSKEALQILEKIFEKYRSFLEDSKRDKRLDEWTCKNVNRGIVTYLPILGFILRSTNVRNAFEVYGPTLRIAGAILEPHLALTKRRTRLILSSEWNYSPLVYRELPTLPGFALIGLPAPESSNPFLIPLIGHELGHVVWERKKINLEIREKINENIFEIIMARWVVFQKLFRHYPEIMPKDPEKINYIKDKIRISGDIIRASQWAERQAEESFCDFMGLYLFDASFLHAFAYLISPILSLVRDVRYPKMKTRVKNLLKASHYYGVTSPVGYESLFEDSTDPPITAADEFQLKLADLALDGVVEDLIDKVNKIVESSVFKKKSEKPSPKEQDRIYERLKKVVPAEDCKTLPDILNAAWKAYEDPDLWRENTNLRDNKDAILKNIVLKNIEVFEIEQILRKSP